ncbi:MAG: hypothetical protein RLY11_1734 [Bacteroidota bacterium]
MQPAWVFSQGLPLGKDKQAFFQKGSKEIIVENFNAKKESVLKEIIPEYPALPSDFTPNLAIRDSLIDRLKDKGEIKIAMDSLEVLNHLNLSEAATQFLANIVFSVNRLGAVKSLNYVVKKGDTIRFSYTMLKGAGFDELEVLEAKEIRYSFSKSPKNVEQTGEFVAAADGIIIFNLTNRGITRSKGKLIVSRKEMQQKLSFVIGCDTLRHIVKEIKQLQDTITEVLVRKHFSIPSKTDITQANRVTLNVPMPGKIPVAIAYWFGSSDQNRNQWKEWIDADKLHSPLELYVAKELFRNGSYPLPEEIPAELNFSIKDNNGSSLRQSNGNSVKTTYATPTLNRKWNYACFSFQKGNSLPESLVLEVQNNSTLYDTVTDFEMIGLFLNDYQAEVETIVATCKEYLTIKAI